VTPSRICVWLRWSRVRWCRGTRTRDSGPIHADPLSRLGAASAIGARRTGPETFTAPAHLRSHTTKHISTHSNPFTHASPTMSTTQVSPLLTVTPPVAHRGEANYGIERLKTARVPHSRSRGRPRVPGTAIRLNTQGRWHPDPPSAQQTDGCPGPHPSVICERGCWHRLVWQALWPTVAHHQNCALRTGMTPRSTAPLICSSKCIGILRSEAGMPRNLVNLIRDTTPFDPRSPGRFFPDI